MLSTSAENADRGSLVWVLFNVGVAGTQGKDSARIRRKHWVCRELGEDCQPHSSQALGLEPPSPDKALLRAGRALAAHRQEKGPESCPLLCTTPWGPDFRTLPRPSLGMRPLGEKRGRRCLGMRAGPEQEASRNQGPPCTARATTLSREGQRGNERLAGGGEGGGGGGRRKGSFSERSWTF